MHKEQQQSLRRLRMPMASVPGTSSSACAACRVLRRKCTTQCLFAPHFPPDQPQKFAHVHKVFGVANVTKMLHELPPPHREDCVNSLAYEADARVQDPVYGCVGSISVLQHQVAHLQAQLALATSEITRLRETFAVAAAAPPDPGTLLVPTLLPRSHSPPVDPNHAAAAAETPKELPQPQPQPVLASIVSRQLSSPVSCEHSPPLLLL